MGGEREREKEKKRDRGRELRRESELIVKFKCCTLKNRGIIYTYQWNNK